MERDGSFLWELVRAEPFPDVRVKTHGTKWGVWHRAKRLSLTRGWVLKVRM